MKELTLASLRIANLSWLDRQWILNRLPNESRRQLKSGIKNLPKGRKQQQALIEKLKQEVVLSPSLNSVDIPHNDKLLLNDVLENSQVPEATKELIHITLQKLRESS